MPVLKQYNAAAGVWQAVGGMGLPQTPVSFSAHKNGTAQTVAPGGTMVKVTFPTVEWSTGSGYDATQSRFQPGIKGVYLVESDIRFASLNACTIIAQVQKNGAPVEQIIANTDAGYNSTKLSKLVYLNGSTDYVEIYAGHYADSSKDVMGGTDSTFFQACLIPDSYDSTKQIIDLTNATSDYLLGVGETAKITYSGVTSRSLRVKTEEGVYELSIDQPYVTTNSVEGGVSLAPNETTYANSFVFSESRTDNAVNVADGAASWSGWHNGATSGTFAIGYVYIMTGKYRISTRTNSKSITGQCLRLGGTTAPLSMQNEVFAGIWKDTTTVWSSLGKITFPFAQSGTIYIKRIA